MQQTEITAVSPTTSQLLHCRLHHLPLIILSPKLPKGTLNVRLPLSNLLPYLLTDLSNTLKNSSESQYTSHIQFYFF